MRLIRPENTGKLVMSTRKNGQRRRKPRPETPEVERIEQNQADPAPDSPRKAALRSINEVIKALDASSDPVTIGQADIHYLVFRAANAPGSEFRSRMRTIAAIATLAVEYYDGGYLRYEGHISQDPEFDMLRESFPAVPPELLHERRHEFLAVLRRGPLLAEAASAPPPEAAPAPPAPAPPPPWELSVITFGPGN